MLKPEFFRLIVASSAKALPRTPVQTNRDYPYHLVEYVDWGGGFVECGGETEHCEAGDIYMLAPGSSNSYRHDPAMPWRKLFFVADGEFCDQLFSIHGFDGFRVLRRCGRLRHFFEEFMLLPQNDSRRSSIMGAALLHSFLAEASLLREEREEVVSKTHAERLRERLESTSGGRTVIAEYAESEGISREHLIRSFREAFGETPYGFQLRLRLENASRLLRYTGLSIKEIAYRLDFCDPGYFSVCFRKKFNVTPRQWRGAFRSGRGGENDTAAGGFPLRGPLENPTGK